MRDSKLNFVRGVLCVGLFGGLICQTSQAVIFDVTVDGPDAIFLAGRTDVVIPIPSDPWTGPPGAFLVRHGGATPEEAMESLPPFIPVAGGDVIKVLDPADGGIDFFNGLGPPFFGPEGAAPASDLTSLGGLSGYKGTQGALAAVFLDDSVPSAGPPPVTLDFLSAAARDYLTLSPGLGQIFFVGDGLTSGAVSQEFVAPAGATRLFFGIPDGFGFSGPPGAYDDNDGSYRIRVGVNEDPRNPTTGGSTTGGGSGAIPEPVSAGLAGMALLAIAAGSMTRRNR